MSSPNLSDVNDMLSVSLPELPSKATVRVSMQMAKFQQRKFMCVSKLGAVIHSFMQYSDATLHNDMSCQTNLNLCRG